MCFLLLVLYRRNRTRIIRHGYYYNTHDCSSTNAAYLQQLTPPTSVIDEES